ncbi:MAG: carbohydrate porin [Candidatus Omnitrophota bacterium]
MRGMFCLIVWLASVGVAQAYEIGKGYSVGAVYTGDLVSNTAGGLKRGTAYIDNLDLTLTVDTAKAGLWNNGTFFVYGLYNGGNELPTGKYIGDLQGMDNIEAPRLVKLFELWYEQRLFNDRLSARAGLYNLNSEFDTTEYGALFLNSSFGIEPTISGNTTSSIFPLAAPAFRLKVDPNEHVTVMAAALGGNPGDEDTNPHGLKPSWNNKTGTMLVGEAQVHGDLPLPYGALPGILKLGEWYHTGNNGFYAIIDQMLIREKDEQGLGVFAQYGQAPKDRNSLDRYFGFGVNYTGLIPGRDEDVLGVAFNRAGISSDYRSTGDFDRSEDVIEAAYSLGLTKHVVLQPDIQFIRNPGADPTINNATVVTLRTKVCF